MKLSREPSRLEVKNEIDEMQIRNDVRLYRNCRNKRRGPQLSFRRETTSPSQLECARLPVGWSPSLPPSWSSARSRRTSSVSSPGVFGRERNLLRGSPRRRADCPDLAVPAGHAHSSAAQISSLPMATHRGCHRPTFEIVRCPLALDTPVLRRTGDGVGMAEREVSQNLHA